MNHKHNFRKYVLMGTKWEFIYEGLTVKEVKELPTMVWWDEYVMGKLAEDKVAREFWYVGYQCECGEEGYAIPSDLES